MKKDDFVFRWNKIADELIYWAPDKIYKKVKNILLEFVNNPELKGLDFEKDLCVIILEMVKDVKRTQNYLKKIYCLNW